MTRVAYVNGRYVPHHSAQVHIEDRSMQFADGVYEVVAVLNGKLVDREWHHERLERSLGELGIAMPMSRAALDAVVDEMVRRNLVDEGIVYLQVGRGVAPREHTFPVHVRPSVVATARSARPASASTLIEGVRVVSTHDQRWERCDVKSVALLPNVLAKQAAAEAGAFEAWQVDADSIVTEGTHSNAWIVDQAGAIVTRPESNAILSGITRRRLLAVARNAGLPVVERAFSLDEAKAAREAFLTSTSSFVVPVVQIDDNVIANGRPGSVTERLLALYLAFASS
ncbi:MAG: D-amino-acid transaminase [Alphaproteobacteria bacterium]|jgi:D-alanine transaminase|nr:D-amino-acid transaminase [Alphaproteobacteria bacterium]